MGGDRSFRGVRMMNVVLWNELVWWMMNDWSRGSPSELLDWVCSTFDCVLCNVGKMRFRDMRTHRRSYGRLNVRIGKDACIIGGSPISKVIYIKQIFSMHRTSPLIYATVLTLFHARFVEQGIVNWAAVIVKKDEQYGLTFLDDIINQSTQGPSNWKRIVNRVLVCLSEDLTDDDERFMPGSQRRSEITKFFGSSPTIGRAVAIGIGNANEAVRDNDESLLISCLEMLGECLRWSPPPVKLGKPLLDVLQGAAVSTRFSSESTCCSFRALRNLCWHPSEVLEKSQLSIPALYDRVRKSVALRGGVPFRNEQERTEACELMVMVFEKHHNELSQSPSVRGVFVEDLKKFSLSDQGRMFSEFLHVWKAMIVDIERVFDSPLIDALIEACAFAPRSILDEGEEDDQNQDDEQRILLMREMVKHRGDETCQAISKHLTRAVANDAWQSAWILVDGCCSGLSPKPQLESFARSTSLETKNKTNIALDAILRQVLLAANSLPCLVEKLKLVNAAHNLLECEPRGRQEYLGEALTLLVNRSVDAQQPALIRRRASGILLYLLRRLQFSQNNFQSVLSGTILPSLIARVSEAFPTLLGPERFVLLEAILVAGKSLPNHEARVNLTRNVLSDPFRVLALHGALVSQNLMKVASLHPSQVSSASWDERGFLADITFLPDDSKQVAIAVMTLSTCSQDGDFTETMWKEMVPYATDFVTRLQELWSAADTLPPADRWALTIHPVDARIVLGGRLAETQEGFIEGLVRYGEQVLLPARMSVVAFLSSVRSCATELLRGASLAGVLSEEDKMRVYRGILPAEHRHVASLLDALDLANDIAYDQVASHVAERLRNPTANPMWAVRTHPDCEQELTESINDANRCSLELAFARSLSKRTVTSQARLSWLAERLVFGNNNAIRIAVQGILALYVNATSGGPTTCALVLRACIAATSLQRVPVLVDAPRRTIVELAAEAICYAFFNFSWKNYPAALQSSKTDFVPLNSVEFVNDVVVLFGQEPIAGLLERLRSVRSDKALKSQLCDFVADHTTPPGQAGGGGISGGAVVGSDGSSAVVTQPDSMRRNKKKKRAAAAAAAAVENEMNMGLAPSVSPSDDDEHAIDTLFL